MRPDDVRLAVVAQGVLHLPEVEGLVHLHAGDVVMDDDGHAHFGGQVVDGQQGGMVRPGRLAVGLGSEVVVALS